MKYFLISTAIMAILVACAPSYIVNLDKPLYTSPSPGTHLVQPDNNIVVRYSSRVNAASIRSDLFTVSGSLSHQHEGVTALSDDNQTIVFQPAKPFQPGEVVSVTFAGGKLGANGELFGQAALTFTISPKAQQNVVLAPAAPPPKGEKQKVPTAHYLTAPGDLPLITATNILPTQPDQYIFVNTSSSSNPQYLLILNNAGEMVYYKPLPPQRAYTDFKIQPNGLLTFFDGATINDLGKNVFRVYDAGYNQVDQIEAGNGYSADSHEFVMLPNGHVLLMIYDEEPIDLSAQGGLTNATFSDVVVQELDTARNVVFQWRASEHLPVTDAFTDLTGEKVDPYHGNAIEPLADGNLLVSFRHLSQIVKVDRNTGDVLWRMGGRHNEFTFTNDEGFSFQHDVRQLPNGHLTVFDNGNQHSPPQSRGVEYAVDETNKTVTRVWQYQHDPPLFGSYMGDVRQLPNGNVWIGWGGPSPIATEVTRDGQLVQEIEDLTSNDVTYRWFKGPWQGSPDSAPVLVVQGDANYPTLYFSWNGATNVAAFQVEAGKTMDSLRPLFTLPKQGFETSDAIESGGEVLCYYRVLAMDTAGESLRYSNTVQVKGASCT